MEERKVSEGLLTPPFKSQWDLTDLAFAWTGFFRMCGYCMEQMVFSHLENPGEEASEEISNSALVNFYLQENEDILPGFNSLNNRSLSETILCMAIRLRMKKDGRKGYRKLLVREEFHWALEEACSKGMMNTLKAVPARFRVDAFRFLFEPEWFWQGTHSDFISSDSRNISEEMDLLSAYISWWLEGENMQGLNVKSPSDEVTQEDERVFEIIFRALVYSIYLAVWSREGRDLLLAIVTKNPKGVPDFLGRELWLQRMATLLIYDSMGVAPLLSCMGQIRFSLFYYLCLKRELSRDDLLALYSKFKSYPPGAISDDYGNSEDWFNSVGFA